MEDFSSIQKPKLPTDEYLLFQAKQQARLAIIKAIGRMVTGAVTVMGVLYLTANNITISQEAWYVIFAVVAGLYGVDGVLTFIQHRNGKG